MSNQDLPPLIPPGGPTPVQRPAPAPASHYPPRTPYSPYPPYGTAPRPPAAPSTGAGWTMVAMLSWWPFGLAAYSHSQVATAALAAGDEQRAGAEGAKARRIGIAGLVYAIVVSSVLMLAILVGTFALFFQLIDAEASARQESATSYADDDEPGSGPADGTSVWELREGDCYLTGGLTDVVRTVTVVPCAEPHGGELYDITYVADHALEQNDGGTYPEYPGDAWMARYTDDVCRANLEEQTGTSVAKSGLHYWYMAPDAWDWRLLDRRIACLVESDTDDLTGRVGIP